MTPSVWPLSVAIPSAFTISVDVSGESAVQPATRRERALWISAQLTLPTWAGVW